MTKTFERPSYPPPKVPDAPEPSADTECGGTQAGRALARRYLLDEVRLLAAIAFASEASLHTKYLAAKEIGVIAGVIPQATPAPLPHDAGGDSGEPL
jgi:hypothetical protein